MLMVEIKNIVNREISGRPSEAYWIQMQLQMECCNIDVCDFVETRFKEYETEEESVKKIFLKKLLCYMCIYLQYVVIFYIYIYVVLSYHYSNLFLMIK